MRVCELRQKEVVNICSCRTLGCPLDIEFNCKTGCVEALICSGSGKSVRLVWPGSRICDSLFLYSPNWGGHYSGGNPGGPVYKKE